MLDPVAADTTIQREQPKISYRSQNPVALVDLLCNSRSDGFVGSTVHSCTLYQLLSPGLCANPGNDTVPRSGTAL